MSRKQRKHQPSKQPVIDICILTVARYDMLEKCLDALYREAQTTPLTINIIDNGGDMELHNQYKHLYEYQPEKDPAHNVIAYRTKRNPQNLGFPLGNNECAKMGYAPLIMFLNDDVELQAGAIQSVVSKFTDATVGIVGTKLLFPLDSNHPNRPSGKVQHVGMAINIRGESIHPLVGWSADNPKCCISRDVWAVTGACLTVRRNVFSRLGGFDSVYGLGTFEDLDLCMKARQTGLRVYLDAEATGYHYTGASAEKLQVFFPLMQNRNSFMSKWSQSGLIYWTEDQYW